MKAYTDIEQSKKLAEILPVESADMYWFVPADNEGEFIEKVELIRYKSDYNMFDKITDWDDTPYVPCWSLTALLNTIIIEHYLHRYLTESGKVYRVETLYTGNSKSYDNPIDAVFEMICLLKENDKL